MRLERDPANSPFVGNWSRAEHASAIAATDREHWIIETVPTRAAAGFLIALDLQACGRGVHIKRIVVDAKDRGLGREAVERFCAHAFADLGAPFVWLDVLARNGRALAAYRAAGLVPRSLPEQEVAEWARAVGGFDDGSVLLFRTAPLAAAGAALVLRDVSEHDLAALFTHQLDPLANRMAAFTTPRPQDRDAFTSQWTRILADGSITKKAIVLDGAVVGHVGCFQRDGVLEVSYWIGREHWGRGIATQALAALLDLVPTRPLYARAAKDNVASLRVLEKCGFTVCEEGRGYANARNEEVEEYVLVLGRVE